MAYYTLILLGHIFIGILKTYAFIRYTILPLVFILFSIGLVLVAFLVSLDVLFEILPTIIIVIVVFVVAIIIMQKLLEIILGRK